MKTLIALILRLATALGLYGKGRLDANKNAKIKALKAKLVSQEEKDKVDEMSDDDVTAALSRMRDTSD